MEDSIDFKAINSYKQNIFHLASIHDTGNLLLLNSHNNSISNISNKLINEFDSFNKAPIHYCAELGKFETLKSILKILKLSSYK
jgi:hypothetical protein